jgi:catechol 2,3-dioxygenase-like lactoylglutathione lyase family enzyme
MQLLGIDNVFFQIGNLEEAVQFYQNLGFKLKFKIPRIAAALMEIGQEEPGLMLCETKDIKPSKLWVEVASAAQAKDKCETLMVQGKLLEAATGFTYEIGDPWGNIVGFADYCKKPELVLCKLNF